MKHINLTEGKTKGAGTNKIPTKPKPNNPPAPQPPKNITLKENGKLTVSLDFNDWNNIIKPKCDNYRKYIKQLIRNDFK
jgi:hypothetical protein